MGGDAGLRRVVVDTAVGPVVARVGDPLDGHVVVLLHGAAGSWSDWVPLLEHAEEAGRPLRDVVAIDLPGWGDSPDPVGTFDAAVAAATVVAAARAAGATSWTVVGHSLGGLVALTVAAVEPGATTGVVLVSPTGPAVLAAIRHPVLGGVRLPWFAGLLIAMRALAALPGGGRPLLGRLGRAGVLGRLAAPLFAAPKSVPPATLRAFGDAVRPAAFLRAARAARSVDPEEWRAVLVPVRSIRGARDVLVGHDDAVTLARVLPDLTETVVERAGHFALVERPDAVLQAIEALRPSRS